MSTPRRRLPRLLPALLLAALLALASTAQATASVEPKTSLTEMERQIMCVLCKTPLATANGPQADAQRAEISKLIAEGKTAEQIKAAMVVEYGPRALALPEEGGFNLAVYLVPIAVAATGLLLLALVLPRWRRTTRARVVAEAARADATPLPELSDEDARRLDEDLRQYE